MYKLLISDLDESLLNDSGNISTTDLATIKLMQQQGVKFIPNTGRGFASVQPLLKQIGTFKQAGEYVISYNGGVIVENSDNHVLTSHYLPHQIVAQIYRLARSQSDLGVHIYTLNDVYVYNIDNYEQAYINSRKVQTIEFNEPTLDSLTTSPIVKILVENLDHDRLVEFQKLILANIAIPLSQTFSSNRYLEFNPTGVDKGNAVLELCQKLAIEPADVITLGDNDNDLPMIKTAGMGVAVSNSINSIKKAAQLTLKATNNDNPITEIYQTLFN